MSTRTPTAKRQVSRAPAQAAAAVAIETARPDRKQAILLAAEKLFSQHGYHVVTIRQIAEEAGVPLALVGYYYGQKHELFHAIFEHWGHSIEARLAGLAAVDIDPDDARTLPRIIDAFTAPVLARIAAERAVAMPIVDAVCRLLAGAAARDVVAALLARPLRSESGE